MALQLDQLPRPILFHPTNDFWQAVVIECLEDACVFWSEWYGRRVKQQWMLLDGVGKVLRKAVAVIEQLLEVRITA